MVVVVEQTFSESSVGEDSKTGKTLTRILRSRQVEQPLEGLPQYTIVIGSAYKTASERPSMDLRSECMITRGVACIQCGDKKL